MKQVAGCRVDLQNALQIQASFVMSTFYQNCIRKKHSKM